jgi:hypothetical protein
MPEVTDNYIRIPIAKKKKGAELRTITITKGIQALYDVENKTIVTYLFDKEQYTMKEAKKWAKDHKETSNIIDTLINLDYVKYKRNELSDSQREEVFAKLDEGQE